MNLEAELDDCDEVQYLKDRTAILDCIATHARGCDRHDVELVTGTYHDDGVDEHGAKLNPGPEYGRVGQRGARRNVTGSSAQRHDAHVRDRR